MCFVRASAVRHRAVWRQSAQFGSLLPPRSCSLSCHGSRAHTPRNTLTKSPSTSPPRATVFLFATMKTVTTLPRAHTQRTMDYYLQHKQFFPHSNQNILVVSIPLKDAVGEYIFTHISLFPFLGSTRTLLLSNYHLLLGP